MARALSSRLPDVRMVGYVGHDEFGTRSRTELAARGIDLDQLSVTDAVTSQVLLFIEPGGERTIISVVDDELNKVHLRPELVSPGDLVYFAAWRPEFASNVRALAEHGATVATVPFARTQEPLPARYVIGSITELPEAAVGDPFEAYRSWTGETVESVVLTRGRDGARFVRADCSRDHAVLPATAVDTTGAGDAFAAGVLAAIMEGRSPEEGVSDGLRWSAVAVATPASIPPQWSQVEGRKDRV